MRVTAISGGVGGAKLALGLNHVAGELSIIANTGDDFVHYGLTICPDIDTILYTLSGNANAAQGWGREAETFAVRAELQALGEDLWFTLGDKDTALHLIRARLLEEGKTLTETVDILRRQLGVESRLLPMSNARAPTRIETADGWLDFQEYFVRQRCAPIVKSVAYESQDAAAEVLNALDARHTEGIIICPSNPLLSIGPILATRGISKALENRSAPALAVSPIVDGAAVKGPTAKMFFELGIDVTGLSVAKQYQGLIDIFVLDVSDAHLAADVEKLGMRVCVTQTLMKTKADKIRLAKFCLKQLSS
jgi:LPPG:FO 2-phospho-L-lactate transferase